MHELAAIGWPVLDRFRFGGAFAISPHGLGIAIGFLIGGAVFNRIAPRHGISVEQANSVLFWALIGAIIGARFFYVVAHLSEFSRPIEWFVVWKGGISLLGGIAGATLINVPRVRHMGLRFFQVADPLAPCLALGIAIGRIGDLIIGDHLGKPTSWLLAWQYRGGTLAPPWVCVKEQCQASLQGNHLETINRVGAKLLDAQGNLVAQGVGVHQTALYDMIGAWVLFALLWRLQKQVRREGVLTLTFGLWYGCMRLIEDSLRIDKRFGPLTGSQWTSLAVVIISSGLLLWWAVKKDGGGAPEQAATASVGSSDPEP